ncbi:MAG: alpha/beta fold hydrolase [Legionellaceae bacterium]|nr:alpha/beta fold hydrolase [Legionellaceae bacterium]
MKTIHITTYGTGKPLVWLHGWGFDSQIWTPLISLLKHNYKLYLVDLPGFGQSPYMEWDDFKAALLQQLPQQFALIGWSMGGLMATRLCIEAPERVTQLMNIASSPRFIQDNDWAGVDPAVFEMFYQQFSQDPSQTRITFMKTQLQGQDLPASWYADQPSVTGLRAGLDLLIHCDLRPHLSSLNVPVCYLFGRLDTIIPRHTMPHMQVQYPDFQYVMFRKAAHVPFLSHQNEFIERLDEFML